MLTDINKPTDDNLGGIFLFKFIPSEDVNTIIEPIDGFINKEIILYDKKRWFDFYGTIGTIGYSEEITPSVNGAYYKKKLIASTPHTRTELDILFSEMRNRQFILDFIDNNGLRKIVGSKTEPLTFIIKSDTKTEASQRNEYTIEFSGDGTTPSFSYNV